VKKIALLRRHTGLALGKSELLRVPALLFNLLLFLRCTVWICTDSLMGTFVDTLKLNNGKLNVIPTQGLTPSGVTPAAMNLEKRRL
jgi:hypothetical protein